MVIYNSNRVKNQASVDTVSVYLWKQYFNWSLPDINCKHPNVYPSWTDTSVKASSCSPPPRQANQNKGCVDPRRTSTLTWMLFQWEGRHEMRNAILCLLLPASLKLPQLSGRGLGGCERWGWGGGRGAYFMTGTRCREKQDATHTHPQGWSTWVAGSMGSKLTSNSRL